MINDIKKKQLKNDLHTMMDQILDNISFESDIEFVTKNYTDEEAEFFINKFSTYDFVFTRNE